MRFIGSLMRKIGRSTACHNGCTALAVVLGLALWLTTPLSAWALTVSGSLTADTSWAASQSPIVLQGNVTLDQDATLTIEPGVEIRMDPLASFTLKRGTVRAIGTQSQPIIITSSKSTPAPGDWGTWRFTEGTNSAQTQWDYVQVEYGSGIVIEKSSPIFNHVAINDHSGPAIRIDLESSPSGNFLSAKGNAFNAVLVPPGVVHGQVKWGLVGIPYLVRQGFVEVGQAAMAIEPHELELGAGKSASMSVVLNEPAPSGGRVVNLTSRTASIATVTPSVTVLEGATKADFEVQGKSLGTAVLSASSVDVNDAQARVDVIQLPSMALDTAINRLGIGLPYQIKLRLYAAAPAGGLTVRLDAEPAGAFELPQTVAIPEGGTEVLFTVRSTVPGRLLLKAQAPGYSDQSRFYDSVQPRIGLRLPGLEAPMVAGLDYTGEVYMDHSAPQGGMVVRLTSSNPAVLDFSTSEVNVPDGQTALQVEGLLNALTKGQAQVTLRASGVPDANLGPFEILSPTTLEWKENSGFDRAVEAWVGRQMRTDSAITVVRQRDGADLSERMPLQLHLRCQDETICSVPSSVIIPAWASYVTVPVTGLALGRTVIEAQAKGTQLATIPVVVVEPQVEWSFDDLHYVGVRRYLSFCLTVPEAGWGNGQGIAEEWRLNLTVPAQIPAGTIAAIYDSREQGTSLDHISMAAGSSCTGNLFIAAAHRGKYRIAAESTDHLSVVSELQSVYGDHTLRFRNSRTEGTSLSVVEGFVADISITPEYQGSWEEIPQPLTVRVRCIDTTVCSAPTEIVIPAGTQWGGVEVPVTGLRPGSTQIEATVLGDAVNYPDTYTTSVEVVEKAVEMEDYERVVRIGSRGEANICIGENSTSYSPIPIEVNISSSVSSVLKVEDSVMEWPVHETCVPIAYLGVSAGTATLSVRVPGFAPLTKVIEVRP